MDRQFIYTSLQNIADAAENKKTALIVTHNNPDPDALSSALALCSLLEESFSLKCSIAYAGTIGRAENMAMVTICGIPLKQFNRLDLTRYGLLALVDGQPGAGNTPNISYDIVIDHHPLRSDTDAAVKIICPDIGVTATIMVHILDAAELTLSPDLATALTYGISSETENLGREVQPADLRAYLKVYARANLRKLAKILHPPRDNDYFQTMLTALQQALSFRHLLCSNLGEIPTPELVAEMADLLLKHRGISWVLCLGRYKDNAVLSLRTSDVSANAGELIRKMVSDTDRVGGHDSMAGGAIPLEKGRQALSYTETAEKLIDSFTRLKGVDVKKLHPLLARAEET